jgi:uncharacterized protein (TIGR02145 family)
MKKKITIFAFLFSAFCFAQTSIGTTNPNVSAVLDVESVNKGFLPPRMTTDQRNAITTPAAGLTIYNTSLKCLETYNGVRWSCIVPKSPTDVYSSSGLIWMDRNLGAKQIATSSTDFNGYGSLFQWGRSADGHQLITWTSATVGSPVLSGTNTIRANIPYSVPFIITSSPPYEWRVTANGNLWQMSDLNNPCPNGYRVPTQAEFQAEAQTWTSGTNPFNSPLKLIPAGARSCLTGVVNNSNTNVGNYWTRTTSADESIMLNFNIDGTFSFVSSARSNGYPIRCIKK